jgi:hypothetical protein
MCHMCNHELCSQCEHVKDGEHRCCQCGAAIMSYHPSLSVTGSGNLSVSTSHTLMDRPTRRLTIDRAVWLRGEGSEDSFLCRESDGKQCCIGIYLQELGVDAGKLRGRKTAADLVLLGNMVGLLNLSIPDEASWLCPAMESLTHAKNSTVSLLYSANDKEGISEDVREAKVKALFASENVDVVFVN